MSPLSSHWGGNKARPVSQVPRGLAASSCPAHAPRSVFLSISLKGISRVQVFGSASKSPRADFSMTCLQASCLECIARGQWKAGCWGGDAGATPVPSLSLCRLRSAKLGEGSFPGHGSAPSALLPPSHHLEWSQPWY